MVTIIDTHHHFIDPERFHYPLLDDDTFAVLRQLYAQNEFLADIGDLDVVGSVHVQAEVDHATDPVLETAWLQSLADAGEQRVPSAAVGYADLRRPDVEDTLERHCQYPVLKGIRQEAWFDPKSERSDIPRDNLLEDERWRDGYRALGRFGLSFDMLVWGWQITEVARFVATVPDVPVVLEHMGMPPAEDAAALEIWRSGMRDLAAVDHAAVKISGLGQVDPLWSTGTLRDLVLETIDIFGVERCIFGGNYPVEKLVTPYPAVWAAFDTFTSGFSETERDKLFHGNARRIYRI